MKKLAVIAAAAMLVFGFVGQAAAYFEDFNLIRSIYTTTGTTEVGSDLGPDVRNFAVAPGFTVPPTNPVQEFRGDVIALSLFDGALESLVVGYWAHGMADSDFWATGFLTTAYGGTDTDGLTMLGKKKDTANATMNDVQNKYKGANDSSTRILGKAETNTYFVAFDKSGTGVGGMGNNLATASFEMTLSLAGLATDGYVDQLLYWFDYGTGSTAKDGVEVAVIRTFLTSDGETINLGGDKLATVINPVPIPGSVLLLASGLLGIFGFRRKRS